MSTTVISSNMHFKGDVRGIDHLTVAGDLKGTIDIEGRLIVERNGVIEGQARVREAWIEGTVRGDVTASTLIHVTSSGNIHGEINAPRMIVDPGAVIRGTVQMEMDTSRVEHDDSPVVDVASEPPRKMSVESIDELSGRTTARPRRKRLIVKTRRRRNK